jgi:hypothetical protein
MLIEKNLSVAATAIGLALAGPDALTILQGQRHGGGVGMLIGGLIGTAGVFLGATIANAYVDRRGGALRMTGWALAALVMTVTVGLGATGGGHRGMRSALGIVGALPVAAVAFVAVKDVIAHWRSRG